MLEGIDPVLKPDPLDAARARLTIRIRPVSGTCRSLRT